MRKARNYQATHPGGESLFNVNIATGGNLMKVLNMVAVLVAVILVSGLFTGIAYANTQTRFYGACGGGTTLADAVAGWKAHGTFDDVLRAGHIDPNGRDGNVMRLLSKSMVHVKVRKGDPFASNTTCSGSTFMHISSPADQSTNTWVWTFTWMIGPGGQLSTWWADNCGNERFGHVVVWFAQKPAPKPAPQPASKPKPAAFAKCVALKKVSSTGQDFILQVVTAQKVYTLGGVKWNIVPTSVINKTTAQFHLTGLTTIVAMPQFSNGKRVTSDKCVIILAPISTPTATPAPTPTTCTLNGVTGTVVNGICTINTTTVTQTCREGFTANGHDINGNLVCVQNTNTNTNTNTVPVTVIVNGGGCSTCSTPAPAPKPVFALNTIEEIDASSGTFSSTRPMCGTVTGKAGDVVTVTFRADYGSFANNQATVSIPSTGSITACATYTAPTHGDVTDHVFGRPYDQTTSTQGDEVSSNGFAVKTPKPNPS
jgi:hypothetical protein